MISKEIISNNKIKKRKEYYRLIYEKFIIFIVIEEKCVIVL